MGRMPPPDALAFDFWSHDRVRHLEAIVRYSLEGIATAYGRFDGTEGPSPGAYLAVVSGHSVADYADPMGENHWPEEGREPLWDLDAFYASLERVASTCDGAVVVSVDGVVNRQLVRFRSPDVHLEYAPWMGARHMSALDISTREEVVVALTLSQESGRVTRFRDGTFESVTPDRFGERWRGRS